MKKIIISSVVAAAALSANAAPLVTIGDQLDLFFRGAVTGKWDSNITYAAMKDKKVDDYSAVFRLGAEADYGRNSKFKANVKFFEDMTRYLEQKKFNSNLSSVFANASYSDKALTVSANFSFQQLFQNKSDTINANNVGELVRYNDYRANIKVAYDFTDKIDGEIGGNWEYTEYLGHWAQSYSDVDVYSIPVSVYYRITEKISAGLTYQYRYSEFSGGLASYNANYGTSRNDHFGGLTVRGELLPKLTATVYAGVTYRDPGGSVYVQSEDDTTFAFNATLGYALTEKIGLFAKGARDFGNAANRQSSINTSGEFGINYRPFEQILTTASFVYLNTQYQMNLGGVDRDDDTYIARAGISYLPNKFITVSANYRYFANSSNVAYATYNQHLVDITFAVKY